MFFKIKGWEGLEFNPYIITHTHSHPSWIGIRVFNVIGILAEGRRFKSATLGSLSVPCSPESWGFGVGVGPRLLNWELQIHKGAHVPRAPIRSGMCQESRVRARFLDWGPPAQPAGALTRRALILRPPPAGFTSPLGQGHTLPSPGRNPRPRPLRTA